MNKKSYRAVKAVNTRFRVTVYIDVQAEDETMAKASVEEMINGIQNSYVGEVTDMTDPATVLTGGGNG